MSNQEKKFRNLSVDSRFPLSWTDEGPKNENGTRTRSVSVGRRVWGKDLGVAQFILYAEKDALVLADASSGYVVQRFIDDDGYSSPWGNAGIVNRLHRVAEWHEAQAFNAQLGLLEVGREDAPAVAMLLTRSASL